MIRSESWGPYHHGGDDWFWKYPGRWTVSKRWAFTNAAGFFPYQDEHFPPVVRRAPGFFHRYTKHGLWIDPEWLAWLDEQEKLAFLPARRRNNVRTPAKWTGGHEPIPQVPQMEIEKRKPPLARKSDRNFFKTIAGLKPGEVARLTTAREGRNFQGIVSRIKRVTGKYARSTYDGDDMLVWLEDE